MFVSVEQYKISSKTIWHYLAFVIGSIMLFVYGVKSFPDTNFNIESNLLSITK